MKQSINLKNQQKNPVELIETHVEGEGPRRGFSLRGWNENLPRNVPMQEAELLGQSLTYIVIENRTELTTTNTGTSHGIHFLNGRNWPNPVEGVLDGRDLAAAAEGSTAGSPWREWTLISMLAAGLSLAINKGWLERSNSRDRGNPFWGKL